MRNDTLKDCKKYLEDFKKGDKITSPGRTITEADIVNFADISGDWNEIHTNENYMKDSSYGKRIAHGLLTLSVARGLFYRTNFSPETVAFLGIENLKFLSPVFVGDTIRLVSEVIETRPSKSRENVGILKTKDIVKKQNDENVMEMKTVLMVKRENMKD
ncbi:hypothetical protein AKJ49_00140 [candidate division MSBL1 archaeon SCGC-AAA382A03]|uniref:MaoC-like domain-containing protein n=1 Tax=candidate division MSBL1 archaeon SCGC-AAA382A03 TaxID=1698278 RepID=A0A133VH69_9EURY|nr:hypothetical protein AKJ49_00140 [candidate division MSBL1 archaeon SCGC-AAA382A03]